MMAKNQGCRRQMIILEGKIEPQNSKKYTAFFTNTPFADTSQVKPWQLNIWSDCMLCAPQQEINEKMHLECIGLNWVLLKWKKRQWESQGNPLLMRYYTSLESPLSHHYGEKISLNVQSLQVSVICVKLSKTFLLKCLIPISQYGGWPNFSLLGQEIHLANYSWWTCQYFHTNRLQSQCISSTIR